MGGLPRPAARLRIIGRATCLKVKHLLYTPAFARILARSYPARHRTNAPYQITTQVLPHTSDQAGGHAKNGGHRLRAPGTALVQAAIVQLRH